jgi:hypothetical protein
MNIMVPYAYAVFDTLFIIGSDIKTSLITAIKMLLLLPIPN